jgi:hypothetical protein
MRRLALTASRLAEVLGKLPAFLSGTSFAVAVCNFNRQTFEAWFPWSALVYSRIGLTLIGVLIGLLFSFPVKWTLARIAAEASWAYLNSNRYIELRLAMSGNAGVARELAVQSLLDEMGIRNSTSLAPLLAKRSPRS